MKITLAENIELLVTIGRYGALVRVTVETENSLRLRGWMSCAEADRMGQALVKSAAKKGRRPKGGE